MASAVRNLSIPLFLDMLLVVFSGSRVIEDSNKIDKHNKNIKYLPRLQGDIEIILWTKFSRSRRFEYTNKPLMDHCLCHNSSYRLLSLSSMHVPWHLVSFLFSQIFHLYYHYLMQDNWHGQSGKKSSRHQEKTDHDSIFKTSFWYEEFYFNNKCIYLLYM